LRSGNGNAAEAVVRIRDVVHVTELRPVEDVREAVSLQQRILVGFRDDTDGKNPERVSVLIGWGDGGYSDAGLYSYVNDPNHYLVVGQHTFAPNSAGVRPIRVTFFCDGEPLNTVTTHAVVKPFQTVDDTYYTHMGVTVNANQD